MMALLSTGMFEAPGRSHPPWHADHLRRL